MKNFRDALREEMKNPEFKKEWDSLEPEFRQIRESLDEQAVGAIKFRPFVGYGNKYPLVAACVGGVDNVFAEALKTKISRKFRKCPR